MSDHRPGLAVIGNGMADMRTADAPTGRMLREDRWPGAPVWAGVEA